MSISRRLLGDGCAAPAPPRAADAAAICRLLLLLLLLLAVTAAAPVGFARWGFALVVLSLCCC